jgi:hypothetical protein
MSGRRLNLQVVISSIVVLAAAVSAKALAEND